VIAFDLHTKIFLTEEGETGDFDEFCLTLKRIEPATIVTNQSTHLLYDLDEQWRVDKNWFFSVTPIKRKQFQPKIEGTGLSIYQITSAVNFLGWKRNIENHHSKNLYHFLLDPITFANYPLGSHDITSILKWGQDIRDFCVNNMINIRPTQGGIGRQFLRDIRFYPENRRKVPKATNEKVRKHMPGGHYEVRAFSNREYTGIYIDQTRAHHFHAYNTELPDANSLFAYGKFHSDESDGRAWRTDKKRIESFLDQFSGLVYGRLAYNTRPCRWIPPCLHDTSKPVWWYTNERNLLDSLEARPSDIIAAWGSSHLDTGLMKFAKWALDMENPPKWLKPILLSTYGTLATTLRQHEVGFSSSEKGRPGTIRAGRGELPVKIHTTKNTSEPSTNNVLHRAMIEAATRCESLMYANYLQGLGHTILCVYVDALIVMDKGVEIPLFDPWRVKTMLHHLRFISQNAFFADELTKMPGGQTAQENKMYRPKMPSPLSHLFWGRDRIRVKRFRVNGTPIRREDEN
jgi:hypothetical protein